MTEIDKMIQALAMLREQEGQDLETGDILTLKHEYLEMLKKSGDRSFDLSTWLPSFKDKIRPITPGEFIVFLADTGVGKSAILQNLALAAFPLKTLVFEIELPLSLCFERLVSIQAGIPGADVEQAALDGKLDEVINHEGLSHLFHCMKPGVSVADIERVVYSSVRKIGDVPAIVMVDYIGLVSSHGSTRYDRTSQVAEALRKLAVNTNTIIFAASQIHRRSDTEWGSPVTIHDAKDSGSIENSASRVIGAWREGGKKEIMVLKVLKSTSGGAMTEIRCNFDGPSLRIQEQTRKDVAMRLL